MATSDMSTASQSHIIRSVLSHYPHIIASVLFFPISKLAQHLDLRCVLLSGPAAPTVKCWGSQQKHVSNQKKIRLRALVRHVWFTGRDYGVRGARLRRGRTHGAGPPVPLAQQSHGRYPVRYRTSHTFTACTMMVVATSPRLYLPQFSLWPTKPAFNSKQWCNTANQRTCSSPRHSTVRPRPLRAGACWRVWTRAATC